MATKTWNQTANNLAWNTVGYWTPNGIPTNTDNLSISGATVAGPYNINLPNGATTFADLTVPLASSNSVAISAPVPGLSCITTYPAGAFIDVKNAVQYIVLQQGFSGTTPLAKRGPGVVYFTAQPTSIAPSTGWTGGLNIEEGIVRVSQANNRLGSGPVVMSAGTTLVADSAARSVQNSFTINGDVTFGEASGQALTITGATFALPSVTATLNVASALTVQSAIIGTSGFTKSGAGLLTVVRNAGTTLSGTIAMGASASQITLQGATSFGALPDVTQFDMGSSTSNIVRYIGNTSNYTEDASFSGVGLVTVESAGGVTFTPAVVGGISGFAGSWNQVSDSVTTTSSLVTFNEFPNSASNIYAFFYNLNNQTIGYTFNASGSTAAAITHYTSNNTGYVLSFTNNAPSVVLSGSYTKNSPAGGATATLRLNGTGASGTLSGPIAQNAGTGALAVTKQDSGKWILSGANAFTGGVTISGGILSAQSATALGSSTVGGVTVTHSGGTGTLDVSSTGTTVAAPMTLNKGALAVSFGGTASVQLSSTTGANVFTCGAVTLNTTLPVSVASDAYLKLNNSSMSGAGFGITKSGAGEFDLGTTANGYTGAVTVSAGTLSFGASVAVSTNSPLGNAASAVTVTGTLKYNGSGVATVARTVAFNGASSALEASGAAAVTFSACTTTGVSAGGTVTFTGSNTGNNTLSANLSNGAGTLNVVKSGVSKWVFSGATLNYTGATTLNDGTLNMGGVARTLAGTVSVAGGLLENGSATVEANVAMTGGTITAQLTGNKTLDVDGGTATLQPTNNANSYTGATTIDAGATLRVITSLPPSVGTNGKVLGDSAVTVYGNLKTDGSMVQKGQMRYGGTLTFQTGSNLYVGGA